jgi:formate hydrogenlyase transcriptional activator
MSELHNLVERAVIMCDGDTFVVDESWFRQGSEKSASPLTTSLTGTLADSEREYIEAALAESHGRVSGPKGAAAKLGIPRQTLESKIRALHIDKYRFRTP